MVDMRFYILLIIGLCTLTANIVTIYVNARKPRLKPDEAWRCGLSEGHSFSYAISRSSQSGFSR